MLTLKTKIYTVEGQFFTYDISLMFQDISELSATYSIYIYIYI